MKASGEIEVYICVFLNDKLDGGERSAYSPAALPRGKIFLYPLKVRREVLYNILIELGVAMKLVRLSKMCLNETYSKV
jgi:hypothetical protein